jgi:hypothetical protein
MRKTISLLLLVVIISACNNSNNIELKKAQIALKEKSSNINNNFLKFRLEVDMLAVEIIEFYE